MCIVEYPPGKRVNCKTIRQKSALFKEVLAAVDKGKNVVLQPDQKAGEIRLIITDPIGTLAFVSRAFDYADTNATP